MGGKSGPEGRIPTRPCQAGALQMATFPVRQYPVRICGAPVRTFHLTLGVDSDCENEVRHYDLPIPRRVADRWLFSGGDGGSTPIYLALDLRPRVYIINTEKSQPVPSQVSTYLGASLDLHKELARPSEERLLNLRQVRVHLPPGGGGPGSGLAQAVRPHGQYGGFLQAENETYSTSPALLLQAHSAPNPPPGADHTLASPHLHW